MYEDWLELKNWSDQQEAMIETIKNQFRKRESEMYADWLEQKKWNELRVEKIKQLEYEKNILRMQVNELKELYSGDRLIYDI